MQLKTDLEREIINAVEQEKTQWENATVYVTERVAFQMRNLIRTLRKNYWGVFDQANDPKTGRKKIWYPLTEELCNAAATNIDLDTKDVNFRAKHPKAYVSTEIMRQKGRDYMNSTYFGMDLDNSSITKAIDGTCVWKVWDVIVNGKKKINRKIVDLLNFYIDPNANSIQEAYRVTERSLMFSSEIASMDWMNNKDVTTIEGLPNTDADFNKSVVDGNVEARDVYEMWGKVPKYWITGKKKDTEEVDGHVIVSGIEAGNAKVHVVEENTHEDSEGNIIKPYEEDWYVKVPNRWYGKGIAESVMMLQLWVNTIINIRINRSYVSQLGLFKIRQGANITPEKLSKLSSNGAIMVQDMGDIEQMVLDEASEASYKDEQNIRDIAQRVTSVFQVVTGESLPSSTPATNAVITSKSAQNAFGKVKEQTGMFVQRLFNRHLMPLLAKDIKVNDLIRFVSDDDMYQDLVDRLALAMVEEKIDTLEQLGTFMDETQMMEAIQSAREQLLSRKELFVSVMEEIQKDALDTVVFITNEEMDIAVTIDKLTSLIPMVPEMRVELSKQVIDLMGVSLPRSLQKPQQPVTEQPKQQTPGNMNLQQLTTSANVGGMV